METSAPTRYFLVRHGETDWNRQDRYQGFLDIPLNARGRAQAVQVLKGLGAESIAAIFTSDMLRALETATILGRALGLKPRVLETLRETNMGGWEGLTQPEVAARYPENFQAWLADPVQTPRQGGENFWQVAQRIRRALQAMHRRYPGQSVVVVSHGDAIRAILCLAQDRDLREHRAIRLANGSISLVELDGTHWRALQVNGVGHLQGTRMSAAPS